MWSRYCRGWPRSYRFLLLSRSIGLLEVQHKDDWLNYGMDKQKLLPVSGIKWWRHSCCRTGQILCKNKSCVNIFHILHNDWCLTIKCQNWIWAKLSFIFGTGRKWFALKYYDFRFPDSFRVSPISHWCWRAQIDIFYYLNTIPYTHWISW